MLKIFYLLKNPTTVILIFLTVIYVESKVSHQIMYYYVWTTL